MKNKFIFKKNVNIRKKSRINKKIYIKSLFIIIKNIILSLKYFKEI